MAAQSSSGCSWTDPVATNRDNSVTTGEWHGTRARFFLGNGAVEHRHVEDEARQQAGEEPQQRVEDVQLIGPQAGALGCLARGPDGHGKAIHALTRQAGQAAYLRLIIGGVNLRLNIA